MNLIYLDQLSELSDLGATRCNSVQHLPNFYTMAPRKPKSGASAGDDG